MGFFDWFSGKKTKKEEEKTTVKIPVKTEVYQPKAEPSNKSEAEWQVYFSHIIHETFSEYEIKEQVSADVLDVSAHPACKPIDFLFYQNGTPVLAVVLVWPNNYRGMNVIGTRNICKAKGIEYLRFFMDLPNEENYIKERIGNLL